MLSILITGFLLSFASAEKTVQLSQFQKLAICYDLKWKKCLEITVQEKQASLTFHNPFGKTRSKKISEAETKAFFKEIYPLLAQREPASQNVCLSRVFFEFQIAQEKFNSPGCLRTQKDYLQFHKWAAKTLHGFPR